MGVEALSCPRGDPAQGSAEEAGEGSSLAPHQPRTAGRRPRAPPFPQQQNKSGSPLGASRMHDLLPMNNPAGVVSAACCRPRFRAACCPAAGEGQGPRHTETERARAPRAGVGDGRG